MGLKLLTQSGLIPRPEPKASLRPAITRKTVEAISQVLNLTRLLLLIARRKAEVGYELLFKLTLLKEGLGAATSRSRRKPVPKAEANLALTFPDRLTIRSTNVRSYDS